MHPTPALGNADFLSLFDTAPVSVEKQAGAVASQPTFWQAVFASWTALHAQGYSVDY